MKTKRVADCCPKDISTIPSWVVENWEDHLGAFLLFFVAYFLIGWWVLVIRMIYFWLKDLVMVLTTKDDMTYLRIGED